LTGLSLESMCRSACRSLAGFAPFGGRPRETPVCRGGIGGRAASGRGRRAGRWIDCWIREGLADASAGPKAALALQRYRGQPLLPPSAGLGTSSLRIPARNPTSVDPNNYRLHSNRQSRPSNPRIHRVERRACSCQEFAEKQPPQGLGISRAAPQPCCRRRHKARTSASHRSREAPRRSVEAPSGSRHVVP